MYRSIEGQNKSDQLSVPPVAEKLSLSGLPRPSADGTRQLSTHFGLTSRRGLTSGKDNDPAEIGQSPVGGHSKRRPHLVQWLRLARLHAIALYDGWTD